MTIGELWDALQNYPDDTEVYVGFINGHSIDEEPFTIAEISMAAWGKIGKNGKFLSGKITEFKIPEDKSYSRPQENDGDDLF